MRADLLHSVEVDIHQQVCFLVYRCLLKDFPGHTGYKALTPELDSVATNRFLETDAVDRCDVATVGDGVSALDGFPRRVLGCAGLSLLTWVPTDCGGVEKNFSTAESCQACGLRVPLIPADEHPDLAVSSVPSSEPEIAWCEIEFFVKQRVVGNMHLAICPQHRAIGVDYGGGVMVEPRGSTFEKRCHDDGFSFSGDLCESRSAGPWNCFRELKMFVVFFLAEIEATEELLGADDLRSITGCLIDSFKCEVEVFLRAWGTSGLDQPNSYVAAYVTSAHEIERGFGSAREGANDGLMSRWHLELPRQDTGISFAFGRRVWA